MYKILIIALILTVLIGILWFFVFAGKDARIATWLNDKKTILLDELSNVSSNDNYVLSEYDFPSTKIDGKVWHLTLVKLDLKKHDLQLIINKKSKLFAISDIAADQNCIVAMNGIFYDTNFDPLGLIVQNGEIVNPSHTGELSTGVFYLNDQGQADIVGTTDFVVEGEQLAFQSGPLLLKYDGSTEIIGSTLDEVDARTLIGVDDKGFVYFGVVYPRSDLGRVGATLKELADVFQFSQDKLGFKLKSVLNLDGGSSTGLYAGDLYLKEKNLPENVLCIK